MEEIVHWYFHPLPLQAQIALPNKNKILNIVPLWVICIFLTDGPDGADVLLHAPFDIEKSGLKLWNSPSLEIFPALWYINLRQNIWGAQVIE